MKQAEPSPYECAGKERFDRPSLAHEVARRRTGKGKPGEVYRCGTCFAWHIGAGGYRKRRRTPRTVGHAHP